METLRSIINFHYPPSILNLERGISRPRQEVKYPRDGPQCQHDSMFYYLTEQRNKPLRQIPDVLFNYSTNETLECIFYQGLYYYLDFDSLFCLALSSKRMWNVVSPKIKRPAWMPAFPPLEDIPRQNGLSFSVFYLPGPKSTIHRLTLTRRRTHSPDVYACFMDGELLYICRASYNEEFTFILFNDLKWNFQTDLSDTADIRHCPPFLCSFFLDDQLISIRPHNKYLKLGWEKFTPQSFHVYVDGVSTGTNSSIKKERRISESVCLLQWCLCLPVSMWVNPVALPILEKLRKKKENERLCDVKKRFLPPNAQSHKDVGNLDKLVGQFYGMAPLASLPKSSPKQASKRLLSFRSGKYRK